MFIRKSLFVSFMVFTLPTVALADITIVNNTDHYGTGSTTFISCSSKFGAVINPHQTYTISQTAINFACGLFGCEAHIFMSPDCSGKEFATVRIDPEKGVVSIDNHDREHFEIRGGGNYITVNPISNSFQRFLRKWF